MKVTPLDIRKKQFEKVTFGGYNKEDVNAFLQALSQAWESVTVRNGELEQKLGTASSELTRLRDMEAQLLRTLKSVEENSHVSRQQAQKEAELIVMESRIKANQMLEDARTKAKLLLRNANQHIYQSLQEMREEMRKLDYNCRLLEKQRDTLINEMRSLVNNTLSNVERAEAHKRTLFYEDEIRKANDFMLQANEALRQEIKDLDSVANTEGNKTSSPKTAAPPTEKPGGSPRPDNAEPSSFFDML